MLEAGTPPSGLDNPKGNLTKMVTVGIDSIKYFYDDVGRVGLKRVNIAGLSGEKTINYKFNYADQCTLINISPSYKTIYHYDRLGRLKDIPNLITSFTYNPAGQIIKIARPSPNSVIDTFTYDNRLRPTQIWTKRGGTNILKLGYWYEPNSNVDSIADYLTTSYSQGFAYDALNRLTNVYSSGGNQTFTYDKIGNRLSKTGQSYSYYSGTNRLYQDHQGWTYDYDNNGNITYRSDGASFVYDWNNRLIQYTKGVASLDFAYNASGLRVKKHYSEGYSPESQGELGSLFTEASNDLGIKSSGPDSIYNKGRDIEKIWVKSDNNYFYFAIGQKYLYNESGKLKLFITLDIDTLKNSGRITLPEDTMTRVSKKSAWEYCIYVGDNDYGLYQYLTSYHSTNYQSMPYGMSVTKTPGPAGIIKIKIAKSLLSNASVLRFTISTFNPSAPSNTDSLYQGGSSAVDVFPGTLESFGGEIPGYGQIKTTGTGAGIAGAVVEYTKYYIYDGINPIVEYAPNGSILARYIYAGGLHIAKIAGADTNWYHCDALGSPRKMTDESGTVTWTNAYYPFGEMIVGSGDVHGFTGKELDETGLNYFCLRYYDTQIGRFITLDPINKPTVSSYEYCYNNPLRYTDPSGADVHWLGENRRDPCVHLMVEERMAQRAGMFYAKSWQLDPFYPSVFNTPDQEIIPLDNGLYRCWFPGDGWLELRPGNGFFDMLKDIWNIIPNIAAEAVFTIMGITDFEYIDGKLVAYSDKIKAQGMSLGDFIVINSAAHDEFTYKHEYAHTIIHNILGPISTFGLYVKVVGLFNYVTHLWKNPYCKPGSSGMSKWEYYYYWSNPIEMFAMKYSDFFEQFNKKR